MVGPVKLATSPRIRRSTSISHKSLGPWDQVFNHRGSRRDWPKDMWICLSLFGHCSQTQVFQPLPSLQLLVPFHLPGHGAKRGRQQDRVISQKSKWSYNQSKVGFLNLVCFWVFHWFSQAMDDNLIILIGGASDPPVSLPHRPPIAFVKSLDRPLMERGQVI